MVESGKCTEQFAGIVQWSRFVAARYVRAIRRIHLVTPLASIVTAPVPGSPASVRRAATRTWREPMRMLSLARKATADAHEFSVEISCGGERVHLRGAIAAKHGAVHFGPHLAVRIDADDAFARECIARLYDPAWQGSDASALFADALLRTLALHVFARYATRVAEPQPRGDGLADALVRDLKAFVDARLDRRLSRNDLARRAGYDAREFSIAFRNTFGMTPMQYVIERRLDRACLLIATTKHDLADIAIGAGFSSQSHLTTTLKKRRGITPLRLRRQSARGNA
jgi:AraC family transcriptional regulator